jgi:2,5-furandicarboxylate decarboxylase 1
MPSTANVDKQSLRSFLQMVETDHPEELLRIRQPVDTRFDMTAIVFELERAGKSPVVIFENPTAHSMPVVTNVAGNRKLLAACLGVEPANLPTAFRERCQTYIPCEVVTDASWHEVVIEGEALDLTKLPIPLQFTVDGGPYITAGQLSARDPVTGVDTFRSTRAAACMNSSAAPRSRESRCPRRSRSERIRCTTWARWSTPIRRM